MIDAELDAWGKQQLARLQNGNHEEQLFLRFLQRIRERSEKQNDSIIAVCGPRNSGKSNIAITASLIERQMGMRFNFDDHLFYGLETVESIILKITNSRQSCYLFDEGIKLGNKKRAMTYIVTLFEEIITQSRKKNHLYFLCVPKFTMLTGSLRNDLIHYWMEVIEQGTTGDHNQDWLRVSLFARDQNPLLLDPWGIEEVQKNMQKRKSTIQNADQKEKLLKRLPSWICNMKIPRLPLAVEQLYDRQAQASLSKYGKKINARIQTEPEDDQKQHGYL